MANFMGLVAPLIGAAVGGNSEASEAPESAPCEPAWMAIARAELGQHEEPGFKHNKRILEYHAHTSLHASDDETPWCSSFANFCMDKAGYPGTNNAAARSWLNWGVECEPFVGAVTVLGRSGDPTLGHVGFLVKWTDTSVWLLAGNQNDEVNITRFPRSRVLAHGFRKPRNWTGSKTVWSTVGAGAAKAAQVAVDAANSDQAEAVVKQVPKLNTETVAALPARPMFGKHPVLTGVSVLLTLVIVGCLVWIVYERLNKGDLVLPWNKRV